MSLGSNSPDKEYRSGKINKGEQGAGVFTQEDVQRRAEQLAIIDGLRPEEVNQNHIARARLELIGFTDEESDPEEELADEIITWDESPTIHGTHVPNRGPGDEANDPGLKLVEEGLDEAWHNQMLAGSEELNRKSRGLEK